MNLPKRLFESDISVIPLSLDITQTEEWQGGDIVIFEKHMQSPHTIAACGLNLSSL